MLNQRIHSVSFHTMLMSDKSNYAIHPPTLRELGNCSQPPNHPFCLLGFSQNTSDSPPLCSNLLKIQTVRWRSTAGLMRWWELGKKCVNDKWKHHRWWQLSCQLCDSKKKITFSSSEIKLTSHFILRCTDLLIVMMCTNNWPFPFTVGPEIRSVEISWKWPEKTWNVNDNIRIETSKSKT